MQILVIVVVAIVIYYSQFLLYRKFWKKNLEVSLTFKDKMIEVGEESEVVIVVENRKKLPLPVLSFKFSMPNFFKFKDMKNAIVTDRFYRSEAFSVKGYERITRKLKFTGAKRGYFNLATNDLIVKDLFLVSVFARKIDSKASFYVLPDKLENEVVSEFEKSVMGEIEVKKSFIEDPFSFVGIREYTINDSMKNINWKATARSNELMVNMHSKVADQRVVVLLNLDNHSMMDVDVLREYGIKLSSTLVKNFACNGIPVMFEANSYDVVTDERGRMEAGTSMAHSIAVDKHLARIGKCGDNEEFMNILDDYKENGHENATYIIISSYYKNDLIEKIDSLVGDGFDVKMLLLHNKRLKVEVDREYVQDWEVDVDAFDSISA